MSGAVLYRTPIAREWIDYNGHLRDAYYALIVSLATDALMERLGMDEAYRQRTRGTLYTLEMHVHFLHEVRATDHVEVAVRILAWDEKRIHAAFDLRCEPRPEPVASAELMLLHVMQGERPAAAPFPAAVSAALRDFAQRTAVDAGHAPAATAGAAAVPGSRRIELTRRKESPPVP